MAIRQNNISINENSKMKQGTCHLTLYAV